MSKVTLDMATFKALASDTRLDILRTLDGKKLGLKDISKATSLNKATLHEHLSKLNEAGLVKKNERENHKWVYYKLTWKGECLLHPENTRIVVLFCTTFICLFAGVVNLLSYAKGRVVGYASTTLNSGTTNIFAAEETGGLVLKKGVESYQNVANVPSNATIDTLSQTLSDNAISQGLWSSPVSRDSIRWGVENGAQEVTKCSGGSGTVASDLFNIAPGSVDEAFEFSSSYSPSNTFFAIVQDPNLLYIALACILVFSILLAFVVWRIWANRTPKL